MIEPDGASLTLDTAEARVTALAGSLYYVAQLDGELGTQRLFETLSATDRAFFERVVRLALAAVGHWRQADEPPAPTPAPLPARLVLALVPRK